MKLISFVLVIAWSREKYMKPKKVALFNNKYSKNEISSFKSNIIYKTNRMGFRDMYDNGSLMFAVFNG